MKRSLLTFIILMLSVISNAQSILARHYVDDRINSLTYLTFNKDGTFQYRYVYDLNHDRATGKYLRLGDTLILVYNKDTSNIILNALTSEYKLNRADTLFIKKHKLYQIKTGLSMNNAKPIILNRKTDKGFKPPKSWRYRRKYLLFGPYQSTDRYYMIDEKFAIWANSKSLKQQKKPH
jgi:hypothetical protein